MRSIEVLKALATWATVPDKNTLRRGALRSTTVSPLRAAKAATASMSCWLAP